MTTRPAYSVLVPVYDTGSSIVEMVDRAASTLVFLGATYEIVLVNDGSSDRAKLDCLDALAERPDVCVVELTRNFGKGAVILCGFEISRGRSIVTIDDDLQYLPQDTSRLIAAGDHDIVIGLPGRCHKSSKGRAGGRSKPGSTSM